MSIILLNSPVSMPPQAGAIIDWGNPITRGLAFATAPIGPLLVDVVNGKTGSVAGSGAPSLAAGVGGRNMQFVSNGAYLTFGTGPATQDLALGPCTFFVVAFPTSIGGFLERSDGDATVGWFFALNVSGKLSFAKTFSAVDFNTQSVASPSLNVLTSYAATYDGVTTTSAANLYIGGVAVSTTFAGGSGSSASDAGRSLFVGHATAGNTIGGNIYFTALFRRILSPTEIASLHRNPYQIFKSRIPRIYFGASSVPALARPQVCTCT